VLTMHVSKSTDKIDMCIPMGKGNFGVVASCTSYVAQQQLWSQQQTLPQHNAFPPPSSHFQGLFQGLH